MIVPASGKSDYQGVLCLDALNSTVYNPNVVDYLLVLFDTSVPLSRPLRNVVADFCMLFRSYLVAGSYDLVGDT